MTQRSPLYVRIPQREWPRELLTWIDSGPQLGIQPTPYIARQSEWPNPVLARANHELRTWANALPPGVVGNPVPPVRNYDWPNPKLLVQNHELRTWLHSQQIAPSTVMPFGQTDWPIPRGQRRNQDLLTWVEGLQQTSLALTLPLRQLDWPNPVIARPNFELRTWTEGLPQTALALTVPPVQRDWQLPPPARPNLQLRGWSFSLQIQPSIQRPFNQFEWPNPAQKPPNLELRAWSRGVPQSVLGNLLPPVRSIDWMNPASTLLARRHASTLLHVTQTRANLGVGVPATTIYEIVPYLIEDSLSAALMRIASIYCTANVIGTTGSVTAQDPAAFTLVARGSVITITLGGTPNNSGIGRSRAQAPYGAPDTAPPFSLTRKH